MTGGGSTRTSSGVGEGSGVGSGAGPGTGRQAASTAPSETTPAAYRLRRTVRRLLRPRRPGPPPPRRGESFRARSAAGVRCRGARFAHQADPPDLALERAEPAADLDAELVEQPRRTAASSTPSGTAHAVQRPQPVLRLGHASRSPIASSPAPAPGGSARAARSAPRALLPRRAAAPRAARSSSRSARCGGRRAPRPSTSRSSSGRGTSSAPWSCARRSTSTARGPKVTGDRPGGQLRHFCVPL